MAGLTVLDASVLIAYLNERDRHHEPAIEALIGLERFAVHPVTLAEVLVHPTRAGLVDDVLGRLSALGMVVSPAPIDPAALARVRVDSGLKMPDCLVVLAARHHGGGLVSFDERLSASA